MTGLQNQHSPSPPPSKKHLERELFSTRHGEVFIRCRRALAGLTRLPTPKRLLRKNNFLALGSQISCVAFHEENPELCTIHFRTPKVIEPTLAILWRSFKTNKQTNKQTKTENHLTFAMRYSPITPISLLSGQAQ